MRIVVCLKQIIDPELPASQFRIDAESKRQQPNGHPLVVSPYDENALELALKLKEQTGGHVAVLSVGQSSAVSALRKGLAMGADEAALISDPALEGSDAFGIATALAQGIQKLGHADLVLCGCESGRRPGGDADPSSPGRLPRVGHELENDQCARVNPRACREPHRQGRSLEEQRAVLPTIMQLLHLRQ